ncbi:MFS transporter [Rickettsia endosymbiont of Halotydeus destructor]|uniref:MFS transporter n=1 Tax=Rickettsia endosymbiont of Halotydeus destructor TaxID=2996754 RepID=UPI003BB0BF4C
MNFIIVKLKPAFSILFILTITFPSGLFFLLSGSTLSFWLRESGFSKITIGLFSLVNVLHIFKFLWGPLLEKISFSKLVSQGYKYCLILSLLGCIICLYALTFFKPDNNFVLFALSLIILGFFSSIYGILIQSSQILLVNSKNWGLSEAACTTGFRIGILVAGSGALYLSTIISWESIYRIMAILCLPSLFLIIFYSFNINNSNTLQNRSKFLSAFHDFIKKPKWLLIVSFMLLYRLQDSFLSVMPNMFYVDIGYSKTQLAFGYKALGLCAATFGGFLGGYLCRKYDYRLLFRKVLVCHALSALSFLFLYYCAKDLIALYIVVFLQQFTMGLTLAPFFSYQLKCCTQKYCITQIAILTSIASITPIFLGSISGLNATYLGWPCFFILSTLCFIPAYILVKYLPE